MKKLILKVTSLVSMIALFSINSQAATVKSAKYIAAKKSVSIEITRGGGCVTPHKFKLNYSGCFESMPVQCQAQLVDLSAADDACGAFISETILVKISPEYLTDSYFKDGSLTITGDDKSSATIKLP